MRTLFAAVAVLVMMGGCSDHLEEQRKKDLDNERFSAGRIGGKFEQDDPIVMMLAPEQREALRRSGMMSDLPPEEMEYDENGEPIEGDLADSKTTGEKIGGGVISVLAVVVPLAMTVAPYLLF